MPAVPWTPLLVTLIEGVKAGWPVGVFTRFGAVGRVGCVVDTATVYGLRGALGLYGAGIVAYFIAATVNWLLNRVWTFRGQGSGPAHQQWARFLGSNPDKSLPTERGLLPGAGAIQAALVAATGREPIVVGKPQPLMLQLAMEQLGGTVEDTAMLGDRLDTDIQGAMAAGLPSIMILTGVSTQSDLESSSFQPSAVVEDLPDLMDTWSRCVAR